jgi:predicted acetyltransferase
LHFPRAKELGLDKVLLTCDEINIPSRKIIEANGGVFEDKRPNPDGGSDKLRYWIALA